MTSLGYGLAAATPRDTILAAARACAGAGFSSFWLNNPPGGDAFTPLGEVQRGVPGILLGTGVVPVSDRTPAQMREASEAAGLTRDRFLLGIGSGASPRPVTRVRAALGELRATTDYRIALAALGPKMCALAGEAADAVLLSWLTPDYARTSVAQVREAAERAGRMAPRMCLYMRIGIGRDAIAKVKVEAERYGRIPSYAANFARLGRPVLETAILAETPGEVAERIGAWDGAVDEIVLRAITANERPEEAVEVVEAARAYL